MTSELALLADIEAIESAVAALQRIKIGNTRTNREIRRLEDELNFKIEKLFNKILRDNQTTFKQIQELQSDYGDEVKGLIRSAIEKVYRVGAEYVGRVRKEDNIFLSKSNIDSISRMADEVNGFFWRQVQQHIRIKETEAFEVQTAIKLSPERALTVATSTALLFNAISTAPLAIATMEKNAQLSPRGAFEGDKIVYWTAGDERVCPICFPLHGNEYDMTDPSIPIPVDDTHERCRCRLLIKSGSTGEVFSM